VRPRPGTGETTFPATTIRCVIAHDHVLFRQGLRRLLEDQPDIDVVSEAGNAAECLRKVYEFRPDVVVADAATFGLADSDAELCVVRESSRTKIVFVSMWEEAISPITGWRSASRGCAVRNTSAQQLVEMIRDSCRCDREDALPECSTRRPMETQMPTVVALTAREREVLKLLAEGKTVRAAATVLGLSSKTVDAHKFNLMRKLGIHNKAELVMWAVQKNVVKVPVNF
jgi:two-component system, NarL family, response regulator NreC